MTVLTCSSLSGSTPRRAPLLVVAEGVEDEVEDEGDDGPAGRRAWHTSTLHSFTSDCNRD